ncbi:MAG: DNA primase [Alistipes sp.]|nr:DNA primase [Alistipes sp.]
MIDRDTVDRIYAAADIVEVINDYVTLKKRGVNYEACCPFHGEKTPSFKVSPSKGLFKCFGCGKGGNAVSFVMEHENISYAEALKIVAKKYGIEVKEREESEEDKIRNNNRESMFMLNSWASDYFANTLHNTDEGISVGLSYFRQARGFSEATIKKFGLGFCPSGGNKMTQDALRAGYKEEFLLSTGLSLKSERDNSLFDRFRERVMFPVHNVSGRIVAFGGRTLRTDKKVAKYQNSPESEIYSKKNEIYGLFFAKKAIQQQEYAIMVEGYTDVISMHQSGVENVVASSGTSLTIEQIRLLARFTKNITVMYDGDGAGQKASLRGIDMILKEGLNVRVVLLPAEDDPDSFARSHSAEEVRDYIKCNSEDFISYKTKLLLADAGEDPIKRGEVIRDMVQSIAVIPDAIQRALYIKKCAELMATDENILVREVAKTRMNSLGDREASEFIDRESRRYWRHREKEPAASEEAEQFGNLTIGSSLESIERELIYYLVVHGTKDYDFKEGRTIVPMNVADTILDEMAIDDMQFHNAIYNEIYNIYRAARERGDIPQIEELTSHTNIDVCDAVTDLLFIDEQYAMSKIWTKKEVHTTTESEVLGKGVPKAIQLFKTKFVTAMLGKLQAKLQDENLSEDEQLAIASEMVHLNRLKVILARKTNRLTI